MPSENGSKTVRRKLADGTVKEYTYARKREGKTSRYLDNTVASLIIAYRLSPEWRALRDSTRKNRNYYLRHLEDYAAVAVTAMRRRTILEIRDDIAAASGHGAANVFIRTASTLFAWAVDREWIETSPAARIRALEGGHLPQWTEAEADHAVAKLPEPLRRAVLLGRYTGQRRSDLVGMLWSAYDGGTLRVHQSKGKQSAASLIIRVHRNLRVELDAWKRTATSTHILTTHTGIPWRPNHLTQTMALWLPKIGLRGELNVHGLRKLAASSLAEAGCSTSEIAAITGHRTLAMVQLYTAAADQERLASSAIVRLQNAPGKRGKTLGK